MITESTSPWLKRLSFYDLDLYIAMLSEVVLDMPLLFLSPWLQRLSLICPCSVHGRYYRGYIIVFTQGQSPWLQRVNHRGYRGYISVITEGTSPRLQRVHHRNYRGCPWYYLVLYIAVNTEGTSLWLQREAPVSSGITLFLFHNRHLLFDWSQYSFGWWGTSVGSVWYCNGTIATGCNKAKGFVFLARQGSGSVFRERGGVRGIDCICQKGSESFVSVFHSTLIESDDLKSFPWDTL